LRRFSSASLLGCPGLLASHSQRPARTFASARRRPVDLLCGLSHAGGQPSLSSPHLLYRGMFWLQFALLAAYVGPLWHSLLVYLDSCPFLPLFTWAHWFELAPHVVSSWHVPVLPGKYGNEEWQAIASLLGIQTTAVGGFMYFLHK